MGSTGRVIVGLTDYDLPADVIDLHYDITHFENTNEWWSQTGLDAVGVLPVVGVLKYTDDLAEVGKTAKNLFKNSDVVLFRDKDISLSYNYKNLFYFWKFQDSYIYNRSTSKLYLNEQNIFPIHRVYNSGGQEFCKISKNSITEIFKLENHKATEKVFDHNTNLIIGRLFYKTINGFLGIKCFDQEQELWQYNVSDYFKTPSKILKGRILVVEDRIIFFTHTEDWENYATFVLNAQTGKVLFTTDQMGLTLYEYNKNIYQIQEEKIKILNPLTTQIKTIELSEELAKRKLRLEDKSACFYDNKLYTLAIEENSDVYSFWLVINLENGNIEYQHEMLIEPNKKPKEDNKAFISEIQANDKLVAVRCTDMIYIFEKEKTV